MKSPGWSYNLKFLFKNLISTDKLANTTTNNGYVQRADIVCTSTSMEISIPATLLPRHNATLRDPACLVRFNGTHHVIDTGLDQCGTTVEISKDSIVFRNELSAHVTNALFPPDVTFSDNGEAFIPLQCEYPRRANVSLEYLPLHHTLRIFERGFGRLDFELRQFKDNEYVTEIASDNLPAKIPLNDQLHVALSLGRSSLTNLGIFVDGCIATPMPSPNYPVFRQLIKNGCASEPEVRVDQSKSLSEFRWSFNVFKFTSTSPVSSPQLVYVHCQVSVCRPLQCAPSCHLTRRRRRGLAQRHSSHLISTGPFVVMKEQDSSNSPAAVVVSTCVAAVACVVAMVAVVAWKRNKGKGYRLVPQTPKE